MAKRHPLMVMDELFDRALTWLLERLRRVWNDRARLRGPVRPQAEPVLPPPRVEPRPAPPPAPEPAAWQVPDQETILVAEVELSDEPAWPEVVREDPSRSPVAMGDWSWDELFGGVVEVPVPPSHARPPGSESVGAAPDEAVPDPVPSPDVATSDVAAAEVAAPKVVAAEVVPPAFAAAEVAPPEVAPPEALEPVPEGPIVIDPFDPFAIQPHELAPIASGARAHVVEASQLVARAQDLERALVEMLRAQGVSLDEPPLPLQRARFALGWVEKAARRCEAAAGEAQEGLRREEALQAAEKALDDARAAFRRVAKEDRRARRALAPAAVDGA